LTFLPYKLITVTAGFVQVDFITFVLASVLARGLRFGAVAWVIKTWGKRAESILDRYFNWIVFVFVVLLLGGFLLLKNVS